MRRNRKYKRLAMLQPVINETIAESSYRRIRADII
ncbi:GntR family transcriptional regulator, partial [Rhizobium ruizarguesonis]